MTDSDRVIVFLLEFMDMVLNRQILENGMPLHQQRCLPQAGHPSVPVLKRMDKNKLIMKNRREDQGMQRFPCVLHPGEQ